MSCNGSGISHAIVLCLSITCLEISEFTRYQAHQRSGQALAEGAGEDSLGNQCCEHTVFGSAVFGSAPSRCRFELPELEHPLKPRQLEHVANRGANIEQLH